MNGFCASRWPDISNRMTFSRSCGAYSRAVWSSEGHHSSSTEPSSTRHYRSRVFRGSHKRSMTDEGDIYRCTCEGFPRKQSIMFNLIGVAAIAVYLLFGRHFPEPLELALGPQLLGLSKGCRTPR